MSQIDGNPYLDAFREGYESGVPTASEGAAAPEETDSGGAWYDYLLDVPRGAARGVVGFGESLYGLADDTAELLGGDLGDTDDLDWRTPVFGDNKTFVGDLSEGIGQFLTAFIPVAGGLGKVGQLSRLKNAGTFGRMAFDATAGAAADFIAWDDQEERLSDLLVQYPALQNPVTEYLSSADDDGWAEARFKNVVEGMVAGVAADSLLAGLKFLKGGRAAKSAEEVDKLAKEYGSEIQRAYEQIENPLSLQELQEDMIRTGHTGEEVAAATGLIKANANAFGVNVEDLVGVTFAGYQRGTTPLADSLKQAVDIREGRLKIEPASRRMRDIAEAMDRHVQENYGYIDPTDFSDENADKMAGWLADEVEYEVTTNPDKSGAGWYSVNYPKALDRFAEVHPELREDQSRRDLFTAFNAILSDGTNVDKNFENADELYGRFKRWLNGEIEDPLKKFTKSFGGERGTNIRANLEGLRDRITEYGLDDTMAFLKQPVTNRELKEMGLGVSGELLDTELRGAHIFGPKLGAFFTNLAGQDGFLTMDRWWSRTMNRYRGNLADRATDQGIDRLRKLLNMPKASRQEVVDAARPHQKAYADRGFKGGTTLEKAANTVLKAETGLSDVPRGGKDRAFQRKVAEMAQERLAERGHDLGISDIQAVAWYFEKRLFKDLGYTRPIGDVAYDDAAEQVIRRKYGKAAVDRASQATRREVPDAGRQVEAGGQADEASTLQQRAGTEAQGQVVKGETEFLGDGRAVIRIFERGDTSTMVHELGHVFRRNVSRFSPELAERMNKAFGVTDGDWTRAHEEAFAESFEKYLADGKAPSKTLEQVFSKFKAWMASVYRTVTGTTLDRQISPEVRRVFDDMLGGADAPKRTLAISAKQERALGEALARISEGSGSIDADKALEGIDFNLDKIIADEGVKAGYNAISEVLERQIGRLKGGVQSLDFTKNEALGRLVGDVADIVGADPGSLTNRLRRHAEDASRITTDFIAGKFLLRSMAEHMARLSDGIRMGTASQKDQARLIRLIAESSELAANIKAVQTSSARTTSAGRIGIDAGLTGDAIEDIIDSAGGSQKVRDMAMALSAADGNPKAAREVIDNLWSDRLRRIVSVHNEVWMNSILSGPVTHIVNMTSTAIHGAVKPIEKIAGGLVPFGRGGLQEAQEGLDQMVGLFWQLKASLKMAVMALKQGGSMLDAVGHGTIDAPRGHIGGGLSEDLFQVYGKNPAKAALGQENAIRVFGDVLGNTVRLPGRFLSSEDELFKQLNYRSFLWAKGMKEARAQGVQGFGNRVQHAQKYISERIAAGGRATDEDALQYAREATFTNDLEYGFGRSLQVMGNKHPLFRLVMPFIRTPTNLLRQVWRRTPGLQFTQRQFLADLQSSDPARVAAAKGQVATGAAISAGAIWAAFSGRITGGGPKDPNERRIKRESGWQPYSLVTTDAQGNKVYTSYLRMDPWASFLGLAADVVELSGDVDDKERSELYVGLLTAVAKNVTSKTYLTGLSEVVDVLTDPERNAQTWFERRAGSYVPNYLRQTNDDKTLREVRSVVDSIRSRVPGESRQLDPKRNLLGDPITLPPGWALGDLSPFYQTTGTSDAVKQELADLSYGFQMPSEKVYGGFDLAQIKHPKTGHTAYDRMVELTGEVKLGGRTLKEALDDLISSEQYQALPRGSALGDEFESGRIPLIRSFLRAYRKAALHKTLQELPDLKQALQRHIITQRRVAILGQAADSSSSNN